MTTLMKLLVALGVDTSEYDKGLTAAEKTAKTKAEKIGANLSTIGTSMMKVGAGMTATMTLPIVAGMGASINAASDLNETMSKVGVVFGDQADRVTKFGESAATALGMSKNEALSAAGTFGNLFRAMEMSETTSADMSTSLVQLSADLASFNNMDPTEVLEKLRSGISGEAEPLKSLGVNINEAMVKAKALEMGLMTLGGELSVAGAAQARYALIMEQTSLAQGDFARTSDGLANQTRIMKAQLADAAATLGQNLLPIAVTVVGWLNKLLEAFNNLSPGMQKTILISLAVVAAAGPVITVIGAITSAVGALTTAWATLGPIVTGTIIPALTAISLPVLALIAAIGLLIGVIIVFGKDAVNTWNMVMQIIRTVVGEIITKNIDVLKAAISGIVGVIQDVITWVGNLGAKFMSLKIPSWLTPGSPTPFEMGLRGINDEMKRAVDGVLPEFSADLNIKRGAGMAAPAAAQTMQSPVIDYEALARAVRDAIVQVTG